VYSKYQSIEEAKRNVKFSMLDVADSPVDIVYQATDEDDMFLYLHDVNQNANKDDNTDGLSPYGDV
jgi:hypothetical protein